MACSSLAVGEFRLAQRLTLQAAIHGGYMDIMDVKIALKRYIMELKCELTGWDRSIPIEALEKWIKRVERHLIGYLGENDDQHD